MEAKREADAVKTQASFLRRNPWIKWLAGGVVLALAGAAVVVTILLHRAEPILRARIVKELQDHFHARVELDSFHVSLVNGLWAEGKGLRIWPPDQVVGVPVPGLAGQSAPLIRLEEFRFHAPLDYMPGRPIHISVVQLKGLEVILPSRSQFSHAIAGVGGQSRSGGRLSVKVDGVECSGARLVLETSKPGKLPMEFAIARLKLTKISSNGVMGFDAELTNPRPVGTIHSTGSFGPWLVADPGESPITGDYRFDHADLSIFHGIAGILNSTGHYQGTLRELAVDGETDTPDFRLTHFGNALPLRTRFHAMVDATNGDTWLEPVDATLGGSHFTAQGQVVRVIAAEAGAPAHSIGHDIALTVTMDHARIEDFLRLASHSGQSLLTGAVTMKTTLRIPPSPLPVHMRIRLAGTFVLDQAQFTSTKIQNGIEQLSLRGQGRPNDVKITDPDSIQSQMLGGFSLAGGVLTLPRLEYTVPGADIQLQGTYGLDGGKMDFTGTARTQATVSKMVGGWKGFLLKPVDRYFKRDGAGAEIFIHIGGTRENPNFGIDFSRKKTNSDTPR